VGAVFWRELNLEMTANQATRIEPAAHLSAAELKTAVKVLQSASERFVQTDGERTEIWAASQDWFLESWGRDTFIALPGILLSTQQFETAKQVFRTFAEYAQNGLIPNRIRDHEILYNTADASLWFGLALKKYLAVTGDSDFVAEMWPTVESILKAYQNGTHYHYAGQDHFIGADSDGLIVSPTQATWMDADPSGHGQSPVTPRYGKAVEINALWYGLMSFSQTLYPDREQAKYLKSFRLKFNRRFWNDDEDCLLDVVDGDPHSGALRPNQIFAISQAEDLLSNTRQRKVFKSVTSDLLTPGGLRTLSPRDSHYHGIYDTAAPMSVKDWAYHQGAVWPWLIGPYIDALFIVRLGRGKYEDVVQKEALEILTPLLKFALESEHKSLPEVFSGEAPHEPGGTRSQAWSVAEVLRVVTAYDLV